MAASAEYEKYLTGESDDPRRSRGNRAPLQRKPELEKVDETELEPTEKEKKTCPDYFGVKSYLHNFYEYTKDTADIFEEDDDDEDSYYYLLHPNRRRRRCNSIWWKIFVWIGANFLIFGLILILVGYLVPRQGVIVANGEHLAVVDEDAIHYNYVLEVCKLIGLVMFCSGGFTLCVALLFPSFLHKCFEHKKVKKDSESIKSMLHAEEIPPLSPVEMKVPATSLISEVQPARRNSDAIVTEDGIVEYYDVAE